MNSAWLRPYSPGRGRWLVVAWEFGGLALVDWTTVRLFDLSPPDTWVLSGVLALAWLVGSWRILRMGVYVNDHGVRVQGLLAARTLRWTDIDQFEIDQGTFRLGSIQVRTGLTVLIRHRSGEFVNTPLWAQGIDFHSRPRVFREVYGLLCERHSAALGPA